MMKRLFILTSAALAAACGSTPTSPPPQIDSYQPRTTEAQLAEVRAAIAPYLDIAAAKRAGWKPFGGDTPLMGEHWYREGGPDYVHGDVIDFSQPSNLMYTKIDGKMVLTGVAFVVRIGADEPLPEGFAGNDDVWHVHDLEAALAAATEERPILRWLVNGWLEQAYRSKGDRRGRLAMVHAWVTLPNPDGPFADYNRLVPYLQLGLPQSFADDASESAARGLALATERGCNNLLDGALWIAKADGRQKQRLMTSCESAAASLRTALGAGKQAVNEAGERAWLEFDRVYQAELTPDQKRRIAAITEHPSSAHGKAHGHAHGEAHKSHSH